MSFRALMYTLYSRLQRLLAPGLTNSHYAYKDALVEAVGLGSCWLDLGCGHQILPEWVANREEHETKITLRARFVVGIDADESAVHEHRRIRNRVVGNIEELPFRDMCFDVVTANVVVEHVRNPEMLVREIHRVLKPGGIFLFHTPNLVSYGTLLAAAMPRKVRVRLASFLQARREEDVFPTFYRFNTARGISELAAANDFTVVKLGFVESSAQSVMLGPIVVVWELLLIRALRNDLLRGFRTNIVAILKRGPQERFPISDTREVLVNSATGSPGVHPSS